MRYLLAPVVLVALLFAAPAYAETIVMECQKATEADPTHFKYESPLIGKAKVFLREDGQWVEWLGARVGERSAVGEYVDYGDEYQDHRKWVLDFAFFKYTRTLYVTNEDGSPLVPGKERHDRAKPEIKEMLCKKPDESWADRKNR